MIEIIVFHNLFKRVRLHVTQLYLVLSIYTERITNFNLQINYFSNFNL